MEKTKKKKVKEDDEDRRDGTNAASQEQEKLQEKLRHKVTDLIKKRKLPAVQKLVKGQDDLKPWGQEAKAKVF